MGKQRKKITVEYDRYSPNSFDWEPVARELYEAGKISVNALSMPNYTAAEQREQREQFEAYRARREAEHAQQTSSRRAR